jgi:hypothetical protein
MKPTHHLARASIFGNSNGVDFNHQLSPNQLSQNLENTWTRSDRQHTRRCQENEKQPVIEHANAYVDSCSHQLARPPKPSLKGLWSTFVFDRLFRPS